MPLLFISSTTGFSDVENEVPVCGSRKNSNAKRLKYVMGDALTDDPNCIGPDDQPYPRYSTIVGYLLKRIYQIRKFNATKLAVEQKCCQFSFR